MIDRRVVTHRLAGPPLMSRKDHGPQGPPLHVTVGARKALTFLLHEADMRGCGASEFILRAVDLAREEIVKNRDVEVAAVQWWQEQPDLHPLTCNQNGSHAPLMPVRDPESHRVFLRCPTCRWQQKTVPTAVTQAYAQHVYAP